MKGEQVNYPHAENYRWKPGHSRPAPAGKDRSTASKCAICGTRISANKTTCRKCGDETGAQ